MQTNGTYGKHPATGKHANKQTNKHAHDNVLFQLRRNGKRLQGESQRFSFVVGVFFSGLCLKALSKFLAILELQNSK